MSSIRIGVVGCAGRMGQMLLQEIAATEGCVIAGGTERPGHDAIGKDVAVGAGLAAIGVAVLDDAAKLFPACDAVLDFTSPAASLRHAELAATHKVALVLGTTGFEAAQQKAIERAAERAAIVQAANMSVGVNLILRWVEQTARALDEGYDIEIVEMHHRHKVDAPSGTALALGCAAAKGRKVVLDEAAVRGRDGITGARKAGSIGFAALRGGDVVGDHTVVFAADGERIELTHKASSRQVFARGAVRAARWVAGRAPGLYGMDDVLGFRD